jgi:xanthine dehydrogenase accessory factor
VEHLKAFSFAELEVARIHAPVGLNIGAVSPAEIAVSVQAEVIATLCKNRGLSTRRSG